jgi:hypothetical protein
MSEQRRGGARKQKSVEELVLTMPAVETVAELGQVLLNVPVVEAVECPDDERLGVGYDYVSPVQNILLGPAGSNGRLVDEPARRQAVVHAEPVSTDRASRAYTGHSECLDTAGIETPDHLYLGEARPPVSSKPDGDKRLGAPGATAALAWVGSTEVGFVHLHDAVQLVAGITVRHRRPELVHHQPGTMVWYAEFLAELQRRMTTLVLGSQKDGPEPLAQRCTSPVEDRSRGYGNLASTSSALPQCARSHPPGSGGAAPRTCKSVGKPDTDQVFRATALVREPLLEVQ